MREKGLDIILQQSHVRVAVRQPLHAVPFKGVLFNVFTNKNTCGNGMTNNKEMARGGRDGGGGCRVDSAYDQNLQNENIFIFLLERA